ncbi:MAG: YdbL family protein [Gammaproteobacteria bacterium]
MTLNRILFAVAASVLVGCVTINIYFPEAAAQQAADRIIDEVRGLNGDAAPAPTTPNGEPTSGRDSALTRSLVAVGTRVLDWLVPAAAAAPNFDASSPASRALEQSLKARFPRIKPYLDSGAVGLTNAGLLEIRDRNAIPLAERNAVRQLVTEQNTDWEALYKEIARINGHPEWVDQIRKVFAERWVAKASRGWFYRAPGGGWQQK